MGRDAYGDLYVHVQIAVPTKLNSDQREKLVAFQEALGEKGTAMEESFFDKAKRFFG